MKKPGGWAGCLPSSITKLPKMESTTRAHWGSGDRSQPHVEGHYSEYKLDIPCLTPVMRNETSVFNDGSALLLLLLGFGALFCFCWGGACVSQIVFLSRAEKQHVALTVLEIPL